MTPWQTRHGSARPVMYGRCAPRYVMAGHGMAAVAWPGDSRRGTSSQGLVGQQWSGSHGWAWSVRSGPAKARRGNAWPVMAVEDGLGGACLAASRHGVASQPRPGSPGRAEAGLGEVGQSRRVCAWLGQDGLVPSRSGAARQPRHGSGGMSRPGWVWQGSRVRALRGMSRPGLASPVRSRQPRQGLAGRGTQRHGAVRHGSSGKVRVGSARCVQARQVPVWQSWSG